MMQNHQAFHPCAYQKPGPHCHLHGGWKQFIGHLIHQYQAHQAYLTMELSSLVSEGLGLCGESVRIGDRSFRALVELVFDILLQRKDESAISESEDLSSVDTAAVKQMYTGMVTLVLEAVKVDCSNTSLSSTLEDSKWGIDRIEYFIKVYQEQKIEIEAMLSSTGSSYPHVVDVDWRLDYYIKNNHMDKVNAPVYLITLKTEESGSANTKDVQFSCSMEQLQDLVGKLKEACKTLERTANF